ncbi:MAG: helix-turn-helix domain-containing protein [Acidobacteria bacterium]|nr:helix-turn-helix domain-containing protein [Acidobacteriota bacterium]
MAQPKRKTQAAAANEAPDVVLGGAAEARDLDRVIHQPVRLALVSALAVNDELSFGDLKSLLGVSDGNLSVHARKLEDVGYVTCEKGFVGRSPRSVYSLTKEGRASLDRYVSHMEAVIGAVRQS